MVLLAPTVTALQTLLEVCRAYAGPHDIVYNTTKTVCMLVRPKQSQARYSTRVRLGNEELSFVKQFRYIGHVMTADCRDKDIKNPFRRQNAVGNILVRKFSFTPIEKISNCSSHIVTPFMDVLFFVIHTRTLLENTVSFSDTFKLLINVPWHTSSRKHLRWTHWPYQCGMVSRVTASPNSIVAIIFIKKGWQCKARRERLTPHQSEDPYPTTPTHGMKKRKGKQQETSERAARPMKRHWPCSWNPPVPHHRTRGH